MIKFYCFADIEMDIEDVLYGGPNIATAEIVCCDGTILTHKLVLASVSHFLNMFIEDIPTGDRITLFLPDFGSSRIRLFLKSVLQQNGHVDFDLSCVLQRETVDDPSTGETFVKQEIVIEEEPEIGNYNSPSQSFGKEPMEKNNEYMAKFQEELPGVIQLGSTENNFSNVHETREVGWPAQRYSKKRALYEQAAKAFKDGHFKSYRSCAKHFGLSYTTLGGYIRNGKMYSLKEKHHRH